MKHNRNKAVGKPNKALIAYNNRRWMINRIMCQAELMPITTEEQIARWESVLWVANRMQRITMGVPVSSPEWFELVSFSGVETC